MTEHITQSVNECFFFFKFCLHLTLVFLSLNSCRKMLSGGGGKQTDSEQRSHSCLLSFVRGRYPCSLPPPWFLHLCYLLIIAKTNSAFSFCGGNNTRLCNGTQKFDEKYTFQVSSVKRIHPNKRKVLEELPVDENEGYCGSSCTVNLLQQPGLCLLWIGECGIFSFVKTILLWHSLN